MSSFGTDSRVRTSAGWGRSWIDARLQAPKKVFYTLGQAMKVPLLPDEVSK